MRRIALVSLVCLAVAGTARGEVGMTPLHLAALKGHPAAIKALLAGGANVNEGGVTPLHLAAVAGHPAVVKALVVSGANINAKVEIPSCPRLAVSAPLS